MFSPFLHPSFPLSKFCCEDSLDKGLPFPLFFSGHECGALRFFLSLFLSPLHARKGSMAAPPPFLIPLEFDNEYAKWRSLPFFLFSRDRSENVSFPFSCLECPLPVCAGDFFPLEEIFLCSERVQPPCFSLIADEEVGCNASFFFL